MSVTLYTVLVTLIHIQFNNRPEPHDYLFGFKQFFKHFPSISSIM